MYGRGVLPRGHRVMKLYYKGKYMVRRTSAAASDDVRDLLHGEASVGGFLNERNRRNHPLYILYNKAKGQSLSWMVAFCSVSAAINSICIF